MKASQQHLDPSSITGPKKKNRSNSKFIPNLSQLNQATKELPDPEAWTETNYLHPLIVNEKPKAIEFTRKRVNRGSTRPYRWIYEGKVLIRNRD